MPRGIVAGAMYYKYAVRSFFWPVPPAQPASAVCVVMRSYHEWKTRFPQEFRGSLPRVASKPVRYSPQPDKLYVENQ